MPRRRYNHRANTSFFAFQDIITAVTGILILIVIVLILMLRQPELMVAPVVAEETRSLAELTALLDEAVSEIRELAGIDLDLGKQSREELLDEIEALSGQLDKEDDPLRTGLLRDLQDSLSELEILETEQTNLEEKKSRKQQELEEMENAVKLKRQEFEDNLNSSQVWLSSRRGEKAPIVIELDSGGGVLRDLGEVDRKRRIPATSLSSTVRNLARKNDSDRSYFVFFIRPSGIEKLEPLKEILVQEGFGLGYRALGENTELKLLSPTENVTAP